MRFTCIASAFFLFTGQRVYAQILLDWKPREDLNILLPQSIRIYEGNGSLHDNNPVRVVFATVNINDQALTVQVKGSNQKRQTTKEAFEEHDGILAINGGYFSSTQSVSLLVSNGLVVSPDRNKTVTRGAFGLVDGKPAITWAYVKDNVLLHYSSPINPLTNKKQTAKRWSPSQAVGGGPVLLKNGKIHVTDSAEGFGGSHLVRHPRTAIGYINDSTLVMMVVDGRQTASVGVTLPELAMIMKSVGCFEAVNLDGGGSSAMVGAGEVVNIPVDVPGGDRNKLRKNASALIINHTKPLLQKKLIFIDTDSPHYFEQGVWKTTNHSNFYGGSLSRSALANPYNKAIYKFDHLQNGFYQLAAWWTVANNNCSTTHYILHHGDKIDTLHFSQRDWGAGGKWNVVRNVRLGKGDYLEVVGDEPDKKIVTDAIRLVAHEVYPPLPQRGDLRIAVISDLNSGLGSSTYEWQVDSIIQRLPRIWSPDLVLCGGDMVAGMGVNDTLVINRMWQGFEKYIAKPLQAKNIPFAFTLGNHDGTISHALERTLTQNYWQKQLPIEGIDFVDQEHFPFYYSFKKKDVFMISIDASSATIPIENLQWLAQQLQREEARQAKFRFVMGHIPLYSVAQERDSKGNVLESHQELQHLLEKYKVHSYISGHQHAYYPGKNGALQLLNAGAGGSGPRRWLGQDADPVNTITLMDVFFERDTLVYTTYDIRHPNVEEMNIIDYHSLPSSIQGVNGTIIRRDLPYAQEGEGIFFYSDTIYNTNKNAISEGMVGVKYAGNTLKLEGDINLSFRSISKDSSAALYSGKHTEHGKFLAPLTLTKGRKNRVLISGEVPIREHLRERFAAGGLFAVIRTHTGKELRAQLYPLANQPPHLSTIVSHREDNLYGIRNTEALYTISWNESKDADGDPVAYTYQLATDSAFVNIVLQKNTSRQTNLKIKERELYSLLTKEGVNQEKTFFQRVITSDGKHFVKGRITALHLAKSTELPDDYIEIAPPHYTFEKIKNATGAGIGAVWDHEGKLWLADYNGTLYIKNQNGEEAIFSPLKVIPFNGVDHSLKPITGISVDNDGNILIGNNRFLLKIEATTGRGLALWEAPRGARAITTPRVNDKGEIYAMSLFADDPNYVLRQSDTLPSSFELVRTIDLKDRALTRTFDMSADGNTLYFPDPGNPMVQVYKSKTGIAYQKIENITSTGAGSNAIRSINGKLFFAVRSSGITPTTLHYRDDKKQVLWTLRLPELNGGEPRGIAASPDGTTLIICLWDQGGGFYRYTLHE